MSSSRLWIQTCVLLLTCFGVTSPSLARSSFDGAWSVVVVTRAGTCTPTPRYPVVITMELLPMALTARPPCQVACPRPEL